MRELTDTLYARPPHADADNAPDTVHELLLRGAAEWPDRDLVVFDDHQIWTWRRCLAEGTSAAHALAERGVGAGHRVMLLLPNGPDWLRAWWGTTLLGGVMAAANPAYRGQLLTDVCDTIAPTVIVTEPETARLLDERHRTLVLAPDALSGRPTEPLDHADLPGPWDPHCLLMTSGTTGPSKASITTHAYVCNLAAWLVDGADLDHHDVFQADMPWFHLSAFAPVIQMMRVGGKIAARAAPAMNAYWATAKAFGSTFAIAPGTVAQFLESQPPHAADRDHRMRFMLCSPLPADPEAFTERFGLTGLCTAYGSTEANLVVINTLKFPVRTGSCGRARPGFDIRIVDEHDHPVPTGQVGELIVRADRPWIQTQGYYGHPAATVELTRNGWIHTGDALHVDHDGHYHFHDRFKDSLRRRGENISSHEVERDVLAYPGITEAACVAHPGEYGGDDEVKVFLVVEPGAGVDFARLVEFLTERMTYFMVPRFFQLIDRLPKTPTQRVQKHLLRAVGNDHSTWDRVDAGLAVTREGLQRRARP